MTNNEGIAKKLINLTQLDIDAIKAYQQAIDQIDDPDIVNRLKDFQQDHKRHVSDLTIEINQLGEKAPENPDLKGFFIAGFTAIRSLTGTIGALKAMQNNEELTTKTYGDALEDNTFPPVLKQLISKNFSDEQRHLAAIKQMLQKLDG